MRRFEFFCIGVFLLICASGVLAIDGNHVVVNSENWEDVYSSMLYATLNGVDSDFLTSTGHGPILLNAIPRSKEIVVVTSRSSPFVFNYPSTISSRGFAGANEIIAEHANLELINDMPEIRNFIVVGNDYGYNSIAVTPYAILTNSWVFLANRVNIAEVESILNRRDVDSLVVYGYVDREVRDALEDYNPRIVDNGNRFEDNVEIVEMFKEISDVKQVLLSNGEFIEKEIMAGKHPVLFTGKDNVPVQIAEYLRRSNIEVGVLIGNELINAATNIRRTTGISVMVKFAQGARGQTSGVSAVEGLDLFYLPTPILSLEVYSIKYNQATSSIELTYRSNSNIPIYIKGTLTAISDEDDQRVGDIDPVFIAPSDYKTLVYPNINLDGNVLRAEVYTLFGEVSTSLDRLLQGSFDMGVVNVLDRCDVEINSVRYNKQSMSFFVNVRENSGYDCFVDVELRDVEINRIKQTIGTEGSTFVKGGGRAKIEIDQRMNNEDLYDNKFVNAVAYFGEREDTLVGVFRGRFDLKVDLLTGTTWMMIIVSILLIVVLLILWKRKKDDEW